MGKVVKKQELDSLTRKYFWEQKTFEIIVFILIVMILLAISFIVGTIYLENYPEGICIYDEVDNECEEAIKNIWGIGIFLTFMGLFIGIILILLISLLFKFTKFLIEFWIENNWEKAEERARTKLK